MTLNRYIKKHRDGIPSSTPSYNTESKQVFSEAQESELESYIKKAALSTKDVRVLVSVCEEVQYKNAIDLGGKGVCRIRLVKRISKETPVIINSCS